MFFLLLVSPEEKEHKILTPAKDDEQLARLISIVFSSSPWQELVAHQLQQEKSVRAFFFVCVCVMFASSGIGRSSSSSYSGLYIVYPAAGWPKMIVQSSHKHA